MLSSHILRRNRGLFGLSQWESMRTGHLVKDREALLTPQVLRPSHSVFEPVVVGACACQAARPVQGGLAHPSISPSQSHCFWVVAMGAYSCQASRYTGSRWFE